MILRDGGVVAVPTETVYGLAADSANDRAIATIYELKRRPSFNPLIAHVADLETALLIGVFPQKAIDLATAFWRPNHPSHRPLTIVVRLKIADCRYRPSQSLCGEETRSAGVEPDSNVLLKPSTESTNPQSDCDVYQVTERIVGRRHVAQAKNCTQRTTRAEHRIHEPTDFRELGIYKISPLSTSGLSTVGIRVPNHTITNEILRNYAKPLSAPSANVFQQVSSTNAAMVRAAFKDKIPLIVDGGQCDFGLESTIVDMSGEEECILRVGGTSLPEIAHVLGYAPRLFDSKEGSARDRGVQATSDEEWQKSPSTGIKAPGMMKKHYSPRLPLKINVTTPPDNPRTAFLGFALCDYGQHNLSRCGDLKEAASNLFSMLFALDDPTKYDAINVAPIPMSGLGVAINDRLQRAAAE
jgi:L-threonylcarbamoyladenylate synthase